MEETQQTLNNVNVGDGERKASMIAGGALALYGLYSLSRRSWGGAALGLVGGSLLYRGKTGHCAVYQAVGMDTVHQDGPPAAEEKPGADGIKVEKVVTINRSPAELYAFWRNFENLPRFMTHLEAVTVADDTHSHWVAKAPLGRTVAWDAEIINEIPNTLIAWQSLPGADVGSAGSVRFSPVGDGRGTEVRVVLDYNPPAGTVGSVVAKLFGEEPSRQVEDDLGRFKNLMEAGEIPTIQGQPTGSRSLKDRVLSRMDG